MGEALKLPFIDLSNSDRVSTAKAIRKACMDYGFFYLVNHGVEEELLKKVFDESKRFFSLSLQEKMKLSRKEDRGYTPLYAERLDPSEKSRAEVAAFHDETYGASAHSDYGMITLLATDGVRGLQICREKDKKPRIWEDVHHIDGAFIVNIGDMMERWTNYLFRSTMHRVMATGQERYSVAFFFDSDPDCIVECLESCCSDASPPRFPPIRSGDYLQERFRLTYST